MVRLYHFQFPTVLARLTYLISLFLGIAILQTYDLQAQTSLLTVTTDPLCSVQCCSAQLPCNCTAGVIASGGVPPYTYMVFSGSSMISTLPCVTGLCPGPYLFIVRDAANNTVQFPVIIDPKCCRLNCRDTSFCYSVPDSAIHLVKPTFTSAGGAGTGQGSDCAFDSIWSNAPGVYPIGTTVVTWYVLHNGTIDTCHQNVIRNPPSVYNISFTTSPPIVAGVINICNGQSITFNDNSTGISGLLWNFGNGYYSTNSTHTEPAWHYPPGTYFDTLTVFDACGVAHDTAFTVVVDSASGPDIFCISVVCPGDTVTYYTNANCTGYTWSVTGGTFLTPPPSTSDSATVIWGAGPTGTITLNVTGCTPALNCAVGTTKTIDIVPATLPIAGDTIVCAGGFSCYEVECIPGNNHSWEVLPASAGTVTGNGTCRICIQWNPSFFGLVTIQLNYQNVLTGAGCDLPSSCTDQHGCGGTGTLTVDVRPIFGISGPPKVCPNTTAAAFNGMNLTNNTIAAGVSWKLITPAPSTLTFATTSLLNAYTWNAGSGIYQLTAYAPPNIYCNDSAVITVQVVNMLVPNNITGPDTVCANVPTNYSVAPNMAGVNYVWTVSGGAIVGPSSGSSVAISWNPGGGTVSVVQVLSTAPLCSSTSSATYTVNTWPNFPLPVVTSSSMNVCLNSTVTYSIPTPLISNGTYTWSIVPATAGNIISANGTNTITIKWVSAVITPIFVKLKISRCYEDSVMVPINLLPLPTVPNIVYFPANPCVNTPVAFSTSNIGPLWNWDFGDAGTAVVQNPVHTYTSAGTFNVQLYVTNSSGCSDTANTLITVDDIPVVPVITGPSSVCVNDLASYGFSQPLFAGANYTWTLSSPVLGIISSSGNNFMNLKWTIPGVDTVKVRVQATCLDTTVTYVVTINALPVPVITVVSPACQNSTVNFTGSGGAIYTWNFTGGSPSFSAISNPAVTYGLPGSYPVSLSVVSAAGCTASATSSMTINPQPTAIISGPSGVCDFPASVTMTAVSAPGYTFLWSPTGATTSSTTLTINALTVFNCIVTNSFGCTKASNFIGVDTIACDIDSCIVNDSISFTYTPPICLSQTYTKIYPAPLIGWNFGLAGGAGAVSPVTATYPYPGIFAVTVSGLAIGTYPGGAACTTSVTRTKNVTIPFDADFDFAYQCNGAGAMQTIFTNTSLFLGAAASYTWQWYDVTTATTVSSNAFPPPSILTPGTHTINLNIFDPLTGATCTKTKTINVPLPIVASFTVSNPLCVGAPNTFTNTSFNIVNQTSMLFNNGNGGTATTSPASIPYASSGSFTATITVNDKYGCTSTASLPVSVTPAGSGTITVGALACDSVSLTASGPGPFTWNIISPPPFPNNPAYVKTSGFYSVTGIGVNGCPYTFGPVQVTVNKSPIVTITGLTQYCQGEALNIKTPAAGVNFAWIRLPATPVGTNSPNLNIIAATPGTFTYQVTVTAANGCTGVATYTVIVDPVPGSASIVASGPLTFCQGDSVNLTVTPPGFTYLWSKSPSPAIPSPINSGTSLWVSQSGTYSVIVQTINGCAYPAIAPVTVVVNPVPPASISGDTTICEGETLTLTSTSVGGATYLWNGPAATGITNPFVKNPMALTDAGLYSVVVTNTFGCTAADTITVIVNPAPVTPFIISNPGGVLCEGQLYNLSVTSPSGPPIVYNWSTGQMGISINAVLPGNYSVTATNQFGCSAQSNTITIHPNPDLSCVPTGCYEFCNECDSVVIPGPFGLANYNWEKLVGGIFVPYSASQNLQIFPPGGKFRLIGSTVWGCADSTDTLNVDFMDCCPAVELLCVDTCENFNTNSIMGFIPNPAAPNVGLTITSAGSQMGPADFFLQATDLAGPSQLLAGDQFDGKWCCGEFCFDFKVFDDGLAGSVGTNPSFTIRNGSLGFRFIAAISVNEKSPWVKICAPISDCAIAPVSGAGIWLPLAGTVAADWPTVLSNVTDVNFRVDYTSAVGETIGFDNICLNSSSPTINAGNDTTVCSGSVVALQVEGCAGIPVWNVLSGDSLIYYATGQTIDVVATQNTCYVVICCGVTACCCDTDTVCVNIRPLPILQWSTVYPSVCQNAAPIILDAANVLQYVGVNWVPLTGGAGFFSGPYVVGNLFTPSVSGNYTICYTYTDSTGCSKTICNTINVIICCDSSFNIDAGPDQVICEGNPAILTVSGCNGAALWFKMTAIGLVSVGQGETIDVMPQVSTCYIVTCCITPLCCDTDTVCVIVNPHPILSWVPNLPTLCANASLTLDSTQILIFINNAWVPLSTVGGTGYFSGPFVVGNVFTPTLPGTYYITYTYTDSSGCSASVGTTIEVIVCCDSTFNISAGADTVICRGSFATLSVSGCVGTPQWFRIGANGLIPVGQGEILDVSPQVTTCFVVICCITPACCDTDTVCVTVKPLPILHWTNQYTEICVNSTFVLNPMDVQVLINNTYINAPLAGGTGVFSGPFVVGNTFTPTTPGTYTICYTYTAPNGCSQTICNTITVIVCCDPTLNINAGPDQVICAGEVAVLTVSGCTGVPIWYQSGPEGLIPVWQGAVVDVFPQTSTCYIVICCITPACCDTDTVCVTVKPLPVLHWTNQYTEICVNSTFVLNPMDVQVFINNTWVNAPLAGGSGVFSGPNVAGNSFTPTAPGTYTICYTYTAPNGCSQTICNTITVIVCCDPTLNINAGPDQVICAGEVAVLTVSGCTGVPIWYQSGPEGLIPVWQGAVVDVFPQTSTCYIVICCITPACCDTDTVCITVKPLPVLHWTNQYPEICVNSTFVLNPMDVQVFINNTWVNAPLTGGSGVFSGPNVVGNSFTPTAPGTYTICYTYTATNGCSQTICNTIRVIECCDSTFSISAGPDQSICAGEVAILTVSGCNGVPKWYQVTATGPVLVWQGEVFDVFPQTTTCYIVRCCITPTCCDEDTICITVKPTPILHWTSQYPEICVGSSYTLNPAHIQVLINNTWVNAPLAGGTGVFSGPFVVGNTFTPTTPGTYTICYTYTDANGCSNTICNTFSVIVCCDPTFNINAGPDLVICQGNQVNLTVNGCNGVPQWYQLTVEGPFFAGEGVTINVTPQQTVCYMVICCLTPTCCDTDTVCVTVNPSAGYPQWMISFASICQYGVPVNLDPSNIFYTNVSPWLPITQAGGSGFFSGTNVVGNYFYPTTLGMHTITYTYTDVNGCVYVLTNTINVISCGCGPCYHPGAELITNSGFESGNTGFVSGVTSACTCASGTYCIHTNAMSKCVTNQNVTAAGTPTGNQFMIVDGNMPPAMLWKQNVTILNTRTYNFSFWVYGSLGAVGSPNPDIQIRVGSNPVMTLPGAAILPAWRRYFVQFTGVSGTTIEIHQLAGGAIGTAYGIDDISLKPCVRNINITFNPVTAVSCHGLSDGGATGVVTGGSQPYTYEWSSGEVSEVLTNKVAGIYTMTVIDGVGCNHFEAVDITQPDPILISGFTPTSGATGTQVVISGSGFANVNIVRFGGIVSPVQSVNSPTQITAMVPSGVTSGFITVSNASGCSGTSAGIFTVNNSTITLNLNLLLQGFHIGGGQLTPVLFNNGISTNVNEVDTIRVELHSIVPQYGTVAATNGVLQTNGNLTVQFPAAFLNGDYYIVIRHRNSLETWSKFPVHLGSTTNYNFKN